MNSFPISSQYVNWEAVTGKALKTFPFATPSGVCIDSVGEMDDKAPIDFFNLFVDDEMISLMVVETNRYAAQKLNNLELPLLVSKLQEVMLRNHFDLLLFYWTF
ncbi:Transposase IS4 [Popillia japonica]|uniref:Transposase IS4 n=1 Tax=Popillia japonica TaxID=7064 RepID=A0AAW1MHP3_POPJA